MGKKYTYADVHAELLAFVKRQRTQTKAAAKLAMSQAHLSGLISGYRRIDCDAALMLGFAQETHYTKPKHLKQVK